MATADRKWTGSEMVDDAKTYTLKARDEPYIILVDGKYIKVTVSGKANDRRPPIIVEPDYGPFRRSATRDVPHG